MRVITVNGMPRCCGKDVATSLAYAKPLNAIARHVSESHKTTYAKLCIKTDDDYQPHAIFIDIAGVYSLILGSNLASSRALKELDMTDVEGIRLALAKLELEAKGKKRKIEEQQDDLYIMRYKDIRRDVVKIGRSNDPEKRRRGLEACHDFQVEIVAVFPGWGHLEALVHDHLAQHRSRRGAGAERFRVSVQRATETITNAIALHDRDR
jgi:hypothetical protein